MLKVHDEEHMNKVKEFASRIGKREQLEEKLEYLGEYACHNSPEDTICDIHPEIRYGKPEDLNPSFYFVMRKKKGDDYVTWFNGGLIFHGPHDGGGNGGPPTYCVSLSGTTEQRWEIHT